MKAAFTRGTTLAGYRVDSLVGAAVSAWSIERRVAHLAAEGLSNPRIAQTLFVSRKAIEMHLSNAYRKLDIHTRAALTSSARAARTRTTGRGERRDGARACNAARARVTPPGGKQHPTHTRRWATASDVRSSSVQGPVRDDLPPFTAPHRRR